MEHIRLFDLESDYNNEKSSLPKPYVCYIKDTDTVVFQENDIISFKDANAKAIVVTACDLDGDGEISFSEAAARTSWISGFKQNTSITDMSFLKYFTNIVFPANSSELFKSMIACKRFDLSGCNFTSAVNTASLFSGERQATEIILKDCDFSNSTRVNAMFDTSAAASVNLTVDFSGASLPAYSKLEAKTAFIGSNGSITFIMNRCSQDSVNTVKLLCQDSPSRIANVRIICDGLVWTYVNDEWVSAEYSQSEDD